MYIVGSGKGVPNFNIVHWIQEVYSKGSGVGRMKIGRGAEFWKSETLLYTIIFAEIVHTVMWIMCCLYDIYQNK